MSSSYSAVRPVISLPDTDRATFITKVYQHLALAVGAFIAIETALFAGGIAKAMSDFFNRSGGMSWMLLLGAFMFATSFAQKASGDIMNPQRQYIGLFVMAAAQALIFAPFLYNVFSRKGAGDVVNAAVVTIIGFAGLSAVGYFTRSDLSFIRPLIMWGGIAAMLLIGASLLFGMNLGVWFSVGMVALSGAAILYKTQQIVKSYPADAYVAAAVQLFASLMTMFWYILRIFASRD